MLRDSIIRALNKYTFIQFIFVILPVIMVVIYGYAYMMDMLGVARNLEYNNRVSEYAWDRDELHEISYVEDKEDGSMKAVVSSDFTDEVTVKVDDVIFYVQMYSTDWYRLVTSSGKSTFITQCSLFDTEVKEDGVVTVSHESISFDFESGDIVCALSVSDEGLWRVTFMTDNMDHYDLEELYMVELISSQGGSHTVRISTSYEFDASEMNVNFCSNLPSSSLYYNESAGSFVRNVSSDYAYTFVLRSNILIVILSVALYCMLLWRASLEKKLDLLDNRYLLKADIFAFCLLVMFVPCTFIML